MLAGLLKPIAAGGEPCKLPLALRLHSVLCHCSALLPPTAICLLLWMS